MPPRPRALAPVLALVLAGTSATAQVLIPLGRSGSGARAAGMANAFVAVSDDGTAASWNPAGLAQLRKPELSLVYAVSQRGLRLTGMRSPDDRFAFTNRHLGYVTSSLDFGGLALPFAILGKPVTVQLGWQRLYQLSGSLRSDVSRHALVENAGPPTSISVADELRGGIDRVSLAGAVKLTGRTSLGGSLNIWRGRWRDDVTLVESAAEGSSDFVSMTSRNRIRGHNVTAGLLLTYPSWNAGVVYHSPFWSSYSLLTERRSSQAPPADTDGGGGARFRLPRALAAGVAWRPRPHWTLAFDMTHDQWTDALVDRLRDRPGQFNFFDGAPPELSTTRDTLSLNLGVEHLFPFEDSVVPLRLGLAWEPQGPMDPVTRDPANYLMLSTGSGYNTNRLKFDVGVQYRWGGFRGSDVLSVGTVLADGLARDAFGRIASHEWRVKVSAIYRIPDSKTLRGVAGKIFG